MAIAIEDHRGDVSNRFAFCLGDRLEVRLWRRERIDDGGGLGSDRKLLHVHARARIEHRAAFAHADDRKRVAAALCGRRGAFERINRDVGERGSAVADAFAVEEHRGFVLLAFTDDHDAVHRDAGQHRAHGGDCSTVGTVLVATSHPARRGHRRCFCDSHELHGEVAIRGLRGGLHERTTYRVASAGWHPG